MGNLPRVARVEVLDASDAAAVICGGTAAKNPDGLVVVVLAGIDVDEQLRLRCLRHSHGGNRDCRFPSRSIQFHFRRVLFHRYFYHLISVSSYWQDVFG